MEMSGAFAESPWRLQSERQLPRHRTLDRMSYAFEWMGGLGVFSTALLLVLVPWFAAIAVVIATTAIFVVALAALASPYLLVRSVRRRRARRRTRSFHSPSRIRSRSAAGSPVGLGRARVNAFAHGGPDETRAILEAAARDAA
jgi:hypothetical protein